MKAGQERRALDPRCFSAPRKKGRRAALAESKEVQPQSTFDRCTALRALIPMILGITQILVGNTRAIPQRASSTRQSRDLYLAYVTDLPAAKGGLMSF